MTELLPTLVGFPQRLWSYLKDNATRNNHLDVIDKIDEYCWKYEQAINVGDVKGKILDQLVIEKQPQNVLELGTFCGYSAIRIAAALLNTTTKVYTIEYDDTTAQIARDIIDYSGLGPKIEVLVGNSADVLETIASVTGISHFDFVFMDHWKQYYKPDLITMENLQLIGRGDWVVADNVIYPGCPDYGEYVRNNPKYESTNYPSMLEYSNTQADSMEKSVYLG